MAVTYSYVKKVLEVSNDMGGISWYSVLFQRQQQQQQQQQQQHHHHLGSSCSSAATSSTDSSDSDDRCDSSLGLEEDRDFPVKILPHLFLGNAATSEDSEALSRHSIEVSTLVLHGMSDHQVSPAYNFSVHEAFYFLVGHNACSTSYMQQVVQDSVSQSDAVQSTCSGSDVDNTVPQRSLSVFHFIWVRLVPPPSAPSPKFTASS